MRLFWSFSNTMLSHNNKNIPEFFPHFLIVHMVSVYSQLISLNFSPENLSIEWSFLGVRWRRGGGVSIFNSLQPPFTCIIIFFSFPRRQATLFLRVRNSLTFKRAQSSGNWNAFDAGQGHQHLSRLSPHQIMKKKDPSQKVSVNQVQERKSHLVIYLEI